MRLAGNLSQETLEAHRHKHLAYILNEQAQLNNGNNATLSTNLNKVRVLRFHFFIIRLYEFCKLNVLVLKIFLFCIRLGGEETVSAQEVYADISVIWGG